MVNGSQRVWRGAASGAAWHAFFLCVRAAAGRAAATVHRASALFEKARQMA